MILIPVKFCAAKVLHFTHKGGQFFAKTVDFFALLKKSSNYAQAPSALSYGECKKTFLLIATAAKIHFMFFIVLL